MSDYFEILDEDLLGRIGRLKTRSGVVETPALAPVVNPAINVIPPSEIVELGYRLLMTNAYLIKKRYGDVAVDLGVHKLLGVESPVMTDSGAYQLMVYGEVDVKPLEIVEYQVRLGSDIGVILDIPTRYGLSRETVVKEVEETLRRAREALMVERNGMLLVGPVQGGVYLDVVARAAQELSKMDFDIYAVGGPTQLMENYEYTELVRLVMTAKMNLPPGKPLHLFGAGNPMMMALSVAMGADLFDSASYAIYARDQRYMTPHGVYRLNEMKDLPCTCPVCVKLTVEELREMPYQERVYKLALHNLYVLRAELRRIRNAIAEGSLWELVEIRARSHPSLLRALREYEKYTAYIEKFHKVTRGVISGLFFYNATSRGRPEVFRHLSRLRDRYKPPRRDVLLLVTETSVKPFSRFGWISELASRLNTDFELRSRVHVVVVSKEYGIIPLELDSLFPLSQYESALDCRDPTVLLTVASDVEWYVRRFVTSYKLVIVVYEEGYEMLVREIMRRLRRMGVRAYTKRFSTISDVLDFVKSIIGIYT